MVGRVLAARLVIDALAARFGGTVHVVAELAARLAADVAVERVLVITRPGSILSSTIVGSPRLEVHEVATPGRLELAHRLLWQTVGLPALVRRWRGDAVLTISGMLPRHPGVPVVSYLCNPVMFEAGGAANEVRRRAAARTARHARAVVVPTVAMAELSAGALGLRPGVVAHGVDRERFRPGREPGTEILGVGDFYRHKRHDLALAAWANLAVPRPTLRLIGDTGVDEERSRAVREAAAGFSARGEVIVHDRMPQEALAEHYRRARVLLLTSEHESFSMPLLEGLASGVPAVARDLPVLRETGGAGAVYVSGDDPNEWARAIARLLSDDAAHSALRARALEHVAGYDWDAAAAAIRDRLLMEMVA